MKRVRVDGCREGVMELGKPRGGVLLDYRIQQKGSKEGRKQ